ARRTVGLVIDWGAVEKFYWDMGLPPQPPSAPWRQKVPLFAGYRQIGWATSGCWSPLLKKYIVIATVASPYSKPGTRVLIELAVEWERHRVPATVVERPFIEPDRKKSRASPPHTVTTLPDLIFVRRDEAARPAF